VPTGLELAVGYLRCPFCPKPLAVRGSTVACASGHSFDIARQGYVSLLGGDAAPSTADTADMVAARDRFLRSGHYDPVAIAIAESVSPDATGLCLDIGGGTGFYLTKLLDEHPDFVGIDLDLSRLALRRAAGAHPRLAAVVADAWKPLPIRDGAAVSVLSVFSPRNAAEIARILAPDGTLVVVTPTARHLVELVSALDLVTVDERKQERLDKQLREFDRLSSTPVEYEILLHRDDILDAILMGPSARHVTPQQLEERVDAAGTPMPVTVSVHVDVYTHRRVTEVRERIGE
jgi:23S rRNA (guanine745-N1)-methyltransferase